MGTKRSVEVFRFGRSSLRNESPPAVAIAWLPGPAGTRRRVAKPSVEEPDAAEPARPDLWGARVSNDPGLPDHNTVRPHSALGYRPPAPKAISPTPRSGLIMSPALS